MTQEEAIEFLKTEGYDLFCIEDRPTKIIICGCSDKPVGKQYKLEDGKLYKRSGYIGLEAKWDEEQEINEKLNSVREKENSNDY
ncbi:hypothetical protein [Trichococcus flocculiformis]|uniref:hypothetical protein n=1 Tax=Trichococcus flocculiformis TaxID=82803 RepID=UPI003DA30F5A